MGNSGLPKTAPNVTVLMVKRCVSTTHVTFQDVNIWSNPQTSVVQFVSVRIYTNSCNMLDK